MLKNIAVEGDEHRSLLDINLVVGRYQGHPVRPIPGSDDPTPIFTDPTVMLKDPLAVTSEALMKYGPIVHMKGINSFLVADADFVEEMLITNERAFSKSPETMDKISPAIGRGLSTLIGNDWKRQRRLANPSFTRQSVNGFVDVFHECIDEMFNDWNISDEVAVDITSAMKSLTLRIVIKCLFSTDISSFSDDVTSALEVLQEYSIMKLWSPESISAKDQAEYEDSISKIDTIIYGIISARRAAGPATHQDLLAMYMSAVYEDTGLGMGDEQLRHEIMNLFLAGHETTANGVAFALYLLAGHPAVLQDLTAELDEKLAGRACTAEDLKELEFTSWVFKESLRLYPSSWGMSRVSLVAYDFKGFEFPAGSDFIVAQWGLHRSPQYWKEPLRFDPSRFSAERIKDVPKYAYMPFGAGARKCIGVHLAESEGMTILARFAQRYTLRQTENGELSLKARLFMTADPGVHLYVSNRR